MGRKRSPDPNQPLRENVLTVKGTPAWREWVDLLAHSRRKTVSDLIDDALAAYAELHGFDKKPPMR